MAPEDLKRINAYFQNVFRKETFRMSMGESSVNHGVIHTTNGLIAHGITGLAAVDSKYAKTVKSLTLELMKLRDGMVRKGTGDTGTGHFILLQATILNLAACAIEELGLEVEQ